MATLVSAGRPGIHRVSKQPVFALYFQPPYANFILGDLLRNVSPALKDTVAKDLMPRLRMESPSARVSIQGSEAPGYDAITSRFP
jgi:hypothetical protein